MTFARDIDLFEVMPCRGAGLMPAASCGISHRGRRYGEAELRQHAVDPAASPQLILLRQPDDKAGDARGCRRTAGAVADTPPPIPDSTVDTPWLAA